MHLYTQDIYCRQLPKLPPYTSPAIPIHDRPLRPDPHDPGNPHDPVEPGYPNPELLEPSFSDLITAVEQAKDLSEQTRRHWVCSVRQIAKWLNRPLRSFPPAGRRCGFPWRNCTMPGSA